MGSAKSTINAVSYEVAAVRIEHVYVNQAPQQVCYLFFIGRAITRLTKQDDVFEVTIHQLSPILLPFFVQSSATATTNL